MSEGVKVETFAQRRAVYRMLRGWGLSPWKALKGAARAIEVSVIPDGRSASGEER